MVRKVVPAIAVGIAAAAIGPAPAAAKTIDVHPGDSIQRAVDQAHPGDVIKVHAGVYRGGVEIKKDDLTLKGAGAQEKHGTVISPRRNKGSACGFCVGREHGRTSGTRIRGFIFRDFTGYGAEAEGAKDTVFIHDKFIDNKFYGVAAFGSTRTKFLHDVAAGAQTAGFYVGDSRRSRTVFEHDTARDNEDGYLLRDSSRGRIIDSEAQDNCLGIVLLNTGDRDGPGIPASGWSVRDNDVRHNNKADKDCTRGETPSVAGIELLGAQKNSIVGNEVIDNGPSGSAEFPGGIVLFSSKPNYFGTASAQNVIKDNDAHRNSPADIVWDGNGKGNQFVNNSCDTSQPSGLCH